MQAASSPRSLNAVEPRAADDKVGLLRSLPRLFRRQLSRTEITLESIDAALLLRSFESSAEGWFWATDAAGRLTYLSESISPWFAGGIPGALGRDFTDVFYQADPPSNIRRALPFLIGSRTEFEKLTLRVPEAGEENWWAVSGYPVVDEDGTFRGYRGFGLDVSEQRRSSERASRLAMYDSLTGLPNRLSMSRTLERNLAELDSSGDTCAVLTLDLDRFKQVNDTLGHPAGDALLKQVSERILAIVGDRDLVFRLGGDEFQIILPKTDDRSMLGKTAAKIVKSLSKSFVVSGSRCVIGASIGIAVAPFDGATSEDLIRNADLALYAAKESGRGRFRHFSPELLKAAEEKRILEDDLRDALVKGEIFLVYQPVISARENRITGVEALIRWEHPERGLISPAKFIPIAEESGLIDMLGTWALRKACDDALRWPAHVRVAVNVSPIQFCGESFPETVISALAFSGLNPDRLELEITEGVFLSASAETDATFARLKQIGVRLALDDFGTGYSSLSYLRDAPFDKIKIDQSFVRGATAKGSRNGAIIAAIVALAEALDMDTTAEGIETLDELELAKQLRVSHIQGYVYSKPLPFAELSSRFDSGTTVFAPSGPPRHRSERYTVVRMAAAIYGSQVCSIRIRNLSESGALVEGLGHAGVGTRVLVDFGAGQLSLAVVRRVSKGQHGIEFEQPLVDDGDGNLFTRRRVPPGVMEAAGLQDFGNSRAAEQGDEGGASSFEQLLANLGIDRPVPDPVETAQGVSAPAREEATEGGGAAIPTVRELAERYSDHIRKHGRTHDTHLRHLEEHVLPEFGHRRISELSPRLVDQWLSTKVRDGFTPATALRVSGIVSYMFKMAKRWELPGAEDDPIASPAQMGWRVDQRRVMATASLERLKEAAEASSNSQLPFILTLLIETGLEAREVLSARWSDLALEEGLWRVPLSIPGAVRELRLSEEAQEVIAQLPRSDGRAYLFVNPRTQKPYRSLAQSWNSVRTRAGLPNLSIDDLRYLASDDHRQPKA